MPLGRPSAFCCTITPFDERGELDEAGLVFHMKRLADAGVGAYLGTASPGEGHTLTPAETERLYGLARETIDGRVPVRAMGAEPRTAKEFMQLVHIAESVGLDAMQLYSVDMGHSNKPTDEEIEYYFRTLLEEMEIPAVISTHHFGGYIIPLDVFDRLLSDYPNIIGINCTSPDIGYVASVVDVSDARADVHVGGSLQAIDILALGGQGFLSSEGILAPGLSSALIDSYMAGDMKATFDAYAELIDLFNILRTPLMQGGFVRPLKAAMRVLGLPGWHIRPPYLPLREETHQRIAEAFLTTPLTGLDTSALRDTQS